MSSRQVAAVVNLLADIKELCGHTVVLFLWWRSRIFVYKESYLIRPLRHIYFLDG